MTSILLIPSHRLAAAALAILLLAGCRKESETSDPAAAPSAIPAAGPATAATTSTNELTTAPRSVPETAPFFSERFLPPDQRLERRQERIRSVLEPETTAAAADGN